MSNGAAGQRPDSGVQSYHDAGYAFARFFGKDSAGRNTTSYLAQIAGFHSRTHKHADHLSFVWCDRGQDILIDPGRMGYLGKTTPGSALHQDGFWYDDPGRIYVESTRAHNTVEIDGRNFQRSNTKPFGSALVYAGEQCGIAVSECFARYFESIRHRRVLILSPADFLLVIDWLSDKDGAAHNVTQRFHFAPQWNVERTGQNLTARTGEALITVCGLIDANQLLPVVRGQTEPELLGWTTDKPRHLTPTSTFAVESRGIQPAQFATLFTFETGVSFRHKHQKFSPTLTKATLRWSSEAGSSKVTLNRSRNKQIAITLERSK
jgi:heparinase II/III-like protein